MIIHYVLLATDGYVYLPQSPDPCSDLKKKLYVFGFVGGLSKLLMEIKLNILIIN